MSGVRKLPARIFVALVAYLLVSPAVHAWWNTSWDARVRLTFDNSLQNQDLDDFPVLVVLDPSNFDYAKTELNGEDLRFVDADDSTVLKHEIEKWTPGGTSYVWVRVPRIDGSSPNDFIYLYYDSSGAPDIQDPPGVWAVGYLAVWHLDDLTTGANSVLDSTGNAKHGTSSASMNATNLFPAGQIGQATDFDGVADYVRVSSIAGDVLEINGENMTMEAWVRRNGSTPGWLAFFGRQFGILSAPDSYFHGLHFDPSRAASAMGGGAAAISSPTSVLDLTWTYLASTKDVSWVTQYVSGGQDGQVASSGPVVSDPNDVTMGAMENDDSANPTEWYKGALDEVRISSVTRSAQWIAAQYLSMTDNFVTFTAEISGTVFEDVNYGGGAGRDQATSSGVARSGARVELYDSTGGTYVTFTTTDGSGDYSFAGLTPGNDYTVRVVNSTVSSSRTGYVASLRGVQTYRTDAASGSAVPDTARVGGQDPSIVDAGNGSVGAVMNTTTGVFTAVVTGTAQSITTVGLGAGGITGVDFGFNFNTIVNTNDTGQGSLRQFLTNSNELSNAGLAIAGQTAGKDVSIFMISDGQAHPGLRLGLTNLLNASGVAVISPATALPPIDAADTTVDGTTQTAVVNSNGGLLGAGGTVGLGVDAKPSTVDDPTLSKVAAPEVEIRDGAAVPIGLQIQANDVTIRGLAMLGFGSADGQGAIVVDGTASGAWIENNVLGSEAQAFTAPVVAGLRGFAGVDSTGGDSGTIQNNLIGFHARRGITLNTGSTGWTVSGNEIRDSGVLDTTDGDGLSVNGSASSNISGNLIVGSSSQGFVLTNAGTTGTTFEDNSVIGNGRGTATAVTQSAGITIRGSIGVSSNVLERNRIESNYGAGVQINDGASGIRMKQNSFFENGTVVSRDMSAKTDQIGIDLNQSSDDNDLGTWPFFSTNDATDGDDGGNFRLNYPILETASISGGELTLKGWSRPDAVIELFITDADPSDFGEGETWVATFQEGVSDDDPDVTFYDGAINGILQGTDTTNRFSFTVTTPTGVIDGTQLTATGTDLATNDTSEFSGFVTATSTWAVSGTVYHDADDSGTFDAGEQGIGTVWVKLVQGGSVQKVVAADPDSGAYSLVDVVDGNYDVIVDDNNNTADSTPTAPTNWAFQTPAAGLLSVVVAGADVTDQDLGLTFSFDLAADCVCEYQNGQFTSAPITIDGDMADWATVFADPDNNACDATDDTDLDHPVQSTGRNLLRTAVTYDATYFSMWTQRVGSSSNTQNFIYYADTNADGILEDGEPVVVAKWQGNTGTVTLELYGYQEVASGGDPMLDAGGYADGYSMPGDLTLVKTLTMPDGAGQGSTTGATDGTQMEWKIEWSELGVAAGAAIGWHTGSTNSNPAAANLGAQIDDNLGGCGGQCSGSNQFAGIASTTIGGSGGETVYSPHTFTNTGNGTDLFDLTWTWSGDFAPTSVTFYRDLGTVGEFDPADVLLTDTDLDTDPDTGNLAAGASFDLLIAIELPDELTGNTTVSTTATSNFVPGCGGTSIPVSGTVDDPVGISPKILKRAYQADGTPLVSGAMPPKGVPVKYMIYFANYGGAMTDVSLRDVLDAAYLYKTDSMKLDTTLLASVVCPAGVCDEAAIFAQVDGSLTALGDGDAVAEPTDGDVGSYNAGSGTIDIGDQNNANNAQLDVAADRIWALVFTVSLQ